MPIVTLDTNVVVSALRSSRGASFRLLELLAEGKFEIGLTVALVLEYEDVCRRLVGSTWMTSDDVDALIDYFCKVGRQCIVTFRHRPIVADPDDDLVLEAAIASGSDWLTTHNVRDFAGSRAFGVESIAPAEALRRLGEKP